MSFKKLVCSLFLLLLFAACASPRPTSSPLLSPDSPIETPVESPAVVPFCLDKPLSEGDTKIRGTGPAGVPVVLVDVTRMGALLGSGEINDAGTFSIVVPQLEASHRIGLSVGNLSEMEWDREMFYPEGYRCDNPMQVPQVGFFYDSALVEP